MTLEEAKRRFRDDKNAATAADLLKALYYDEREPVESKVSLCREIELVLTDAPAYQLYQVGMLYLSAKEMSEVVRVLRDLAYDEGFAPAQWRLGALIIFDRVPWIERSVGYDLLDTASANGHLRAPVTLNHAKFADGGVLKKLSVLPALVYATAKYRFYRDILRDSGQRMQ
jgi:hypothetical protein